MLEQKHAFNLGLAVLMNLWTSMDTIGMWHVKIILESMLQKNLMEPQIAFMQQNPKLVLNAKC